METIFVTEEYLKQYSIVNDNVDMGVVTPTLIKIQDMYIHPILGTALFEELKTQVGAETVTALNATLLDMVRKCMLRYFESEAAIIFSYRYMNKGVMKKSSDNSQPADLSEVNMLMDKFKNEAEWYAERITKYLMENSNDYPLFDNAGDGIDTISPNITNYTSGIYLGEKTFNIGNITIDKGKRNC